MRYFSWSAEKNKQLKVERNISFEIIVHQIQQGKILDVIKHPNQEKYKNQFIFIVEFDNYAYLVPFIENEEEMFLKTIIPSRKATKKYLGR
jgi:uncharacterized DUF497 family protein